MGIISDIQSSIQSFFTATPKKKYTLISKKGNDHISKALEFGDKKPISVSFDNEHDLHTVELTDHQAQIVAQSAAAFNDIFEQDLPIKLPAHYFFPQTESVQSTPASITATPGILVDIPQYAGTVKGIDVAILDTLIYTDAVQLKPFKVSVVTSYVGNTPCEPHGTFVAEIIAQGFSKANTDMEFKNFAVFDCNGSSTSTTIANAVKDIIDYKKGPGANRKLVVNFSGGGSTSALLNKAFSTLQNNGVGIVVASGNSGELCTLDSPASISSSNALQSIGALGKQGDPVGYKEGQDLSTYSNYGTSTAKCVDAYYQGCYTLPDPQNDQMATGCGTSFAAPVGTIRRVVFAALNPDTPFMKAKELMQKYTVPAIGAEGASVNTVTPAMAFSWSSAQTKSTGALADIAKSPASKAPAEPALNERERKKAHSI